MRRHTVAKAITLVIALLNSQFKYWTCDFQYNVYIYILFAQAHEKLKIDCISTSSK